MNDLDAVLDQEEVVDQEVEVASEEDAIDPLRSFVDSLQQGDFTNAESLFKDVLDDKVQDSLDAEKIAVADQIFNGIEPEEMDLEDEVEVDDTSEVEYGEEAEDFGSTDSELEETEES
jgi:hypothetical protein